MTIDADLMCDALDDLRDAAEVAAPKPPTVGALPAGFFRVLTFSRIVCPPLAPALRPTCRASALPGAVGTDPEFLAIIAPDLYLLVGSVVCAPVAVPYAATEASARATRHEGYSEGLLAPPARETREQRVMADARAFGLAS